MSGNIGGMCMSAYMAYRGVLCDMGLIYPMVIRVAVWLKYAFWEVPVSCVVVLWYCVEDDMVI